MIKVFEELQTWQFEIDEVSVSVYRCSGRDKYGRLVERTGLDPDEVLEWCRIAAREIQQQVDEARKQKGH